MRLQGVAWRFGDHIHADEACQFYKNKEVLLDDREAMAKICMTGYDPDFPNRAKGGDFIVSGRNFGWGQLHSHFYASIKALGIDAIIVESINGRSYREAINSGIRVILCPSTGRIQNGEAIEIDTERGRIICERSGEVIFAEIVSPVIEEILGRGGIDQYLRGRLKEETASPYALPGTSP